MLGLSGVLLWACLGLRNSASQGEDLARMYCASCHLFPEPEALDRSTWMESVLPNMGSRLGISTEAYDPYEFLDSVEVAYVKQENIYPETALISTKDWQAILDYYQESAPIELKCEEGVINPDSIAPFSSQLLNIGDQEIPRVSMLKYSPESESFFVGDNNALYEINKRLEIVNSWNISSPASDLVTLEGNRYLMLVGSIIPNDRKEGVFLPLQVNNEATDVASFIDSLARPVSFSFGDLNMDGYNDLVVCSFGNNSGRLSWFDHQGKEHILSNLPGARKVELLDIDADGDLDIISLMSQAWESIDLYVNEGQGNFARKSLLQFSPLHGSSYFEMVDFNNDGHLDILLTNGDNWDYSDILKPYHGIRIFMNNGKMEFTEAFFFQMPGCSKAIARDFDNDGDLDIVACAFFSARDNSTRSLVYLEGKGGLEFDAKRLVDENVGEWLTMDVADINKDDKLDILLGSYYHSFSDFQKTLLSGNDVFPQVMVLKQD